MPQHTAEEQLRRLLAQQQADPQPGRANEIEGLRGLLAQQQADRDLSWYGGTRSSILASPAPPSSQYPGWEEEQLRGLLAQQQDDRFGLPSAAAQTFAGATPHQPTLSMPDTIENQFSGAAAEESNEIAHLRQILSSMPSTSEINPGLMGGFIGDYGKWWLTEMLKSQEVLASPGGMTDPYMEQAGIDPNYHGAFGTAMDVLDVIGAGVIGKAGKFGAKAMREGAEAIAARAARSASGDAAKGVKSLLAKGGKSGDEVGTVLGGPAGEGRVLERFGQVEDSRGGGAVFRTSGGPAVPARRIGEGIVELDAGDESARIFHSAITRGADAHPLGRAVEVKSPEAYAVSRMFLSDTGDAGMAVMPDGDLVSVFKVPGTDKGAIDTLLEHAAPQSTMADAFDIGGMLQNRYRPFGFVPVARVRWNPAFAPDEWPAERLVNSLLDPEPDVVLLARDPEGVLGAPEFTDYRSQYKEQVPIFDDFDEAVAVRDAALQQIQAGPARPLGASAQLLAQPDAAVNPNASFLAAKGLAPNAEGIELAGRAKSKLAKIILADEDLFPTATGRPASGDLIAPPVTSGFTPPESDLFDLSKLEHRPDVPQRKFKSKDLSKGVRAKWDRYMEPKNVERVSKIVEGGIEKGGLAWYNLEPLRAAFIEDLADEVGVPAAHDAFLKYIDVVAAFSPRTNVKKMFERASVLWRGLLQGNPDAFTGLNKIEFPDESVRPAGGLGHMAHDTSIRPGVARALSDEGLVGNLPVNPKTGRFRENLAGNLAPGTIDVHATEIATRAEKTGSPEFAEFGAPESIYDQVAVGLGLVDDQGVPLAGNAQASAWMNKPPDLGRKVVDDRPAIVVFEEIINASAKEQGIKPREMLRRMIRGEAILSVAGGTVGAGIVAAARESEQ
jgi:hypothetical protein